VIPQSANSRASRRSARAPRNLAGQLGCHLSCILIVAAHEHITSTSPSWPATRPPDSAVPPQGHSRRQQLLVCSAAEPCHTPSVRVAAPPTVAASGTVVSITIVPGFHTLFNCLSKAAAPEKGTVRRQHRTLLLPTDCPTLRSAGIPQPARASALPSPPPARIPRSNQHTLTGLCPAIRQPGAFRSVPPESRFFAPCSFAPSFRSRFASRHPIWYLQKLPR